MLQGGENKKGETKKECDGGRERGERKGRKSFYTSRFQFRFCDESLYRRENNFLFLHDSDTAKGDGDWF